MGAQNSVYEQVCVELCDDLKLRGSLEANLITSLWNDSDLISAFCRAPASRVRKEISGLVCEGGLPDIFPLLLLERVQARAAA